MRKAHQEDGRTFSPPSCRQPLLLVYHSQRDSSVAADFVARIPSRLWGLGSGMRVSLNNLWTNRS
jgi:hypothetical protein